MTPIEDPCSNMDDGYLLVDVLNLQDIVLGDDQLVPCIPSALTNSQELMPCLVDIAKLSAAQHEAMMDIFREQAAGEHPFAICAWLECELEIDELAEHLARFLFVQNCDGAKVLWRYYDPRVFSLTNTLFSDAQRAALLSPIKRWRFTWCRNWWSVSQENINDNDYLEFQKGWPNLNQWFYLQKSRLINKILSALGTENKLAPEVCLKYQQKIMSYLDESLNVLNMTDEDDQSEFVYLCVKYGSAYRRHPGLRIAWDRLTKHEISWTDPCLQLSGAELEKLSMLKDS